MIDPENRDYITSVECSIGSAGETIPPMLLVSRVNILHKRCQHNDLDGDTVIGTTETGYANDDTALEWLQHIIDHTKKSEAGCMASSYHRWLWLTYGHTISQSSD